MRLADAIRYKIQMTDNIILALSSQELGKYRDDISEMVDHMRDEKTRLEHELDELEDGTHVIFDVPHRGLSGIDRPTLKMKGADRPTLQMKG